MCASQDCETKTHLKRRGRGHQRFPHASPTAPHPQFLHPRPQFSGTPLGAGSSHGRRAAVCGAGRPHPRARARGGGRGASFLPRPLVHAGGFPESARTPYSPLTLHQPPLSRTPSTAQQPRVPGVPLRHRRAACTPSGGEAWPPSRDPLRLTTGAAHTHRGLRPTQAWLLPGAAPAQRHLLRTLTQPLGPPGAGSASRFAASHLPVRARCRGHNHNHSDVPRAPAEQRLLSRSPGRSPRAGARCICKETAAHWPEGGGACGARPIKCRPGERGAGGRGGARLLRVIPRSCRRLDPVGALAGRGWSPWGGERRDGLAATRAAEGSGAGGVAREDWRRPWCPRVRTAKPAFTAAMHKSQ